MKKKMKRMDDGGMATTTSAQNRRADKWWKPNDLAAATSNEGNPGRRRMRISDREEDMMRRERRNSPEFIAAKYAKLSAKYPGYTPTLSGPVDTREELKSYREGLKAYKLANPDLFPPRPPRPEGMNDPRGNAYGRRMERPPGLTPGFRNRRGPDNFLGGSRNFDETAGPRKPFPSVRAGNLGGNRFRQQPKPPVMKGGGLARKGVGQALAKGGLVKANGCAKRGKTRGKMT